MEAIHHQGACSAFGDLSLNTCALTLARRTATLRRSQLEQKSVSVCEEKGWGWVDVAFSGWVALALVSGRCLLSGRVDVRTSTGTSLLGSSRRSKRVLAEVAVVFLSSQSGFFARE